MTAIKSKHELEEYLQSVKDTKQRQILTKYRLSEHSLAIETGRHRKSWLPREQRVCAHCETGEIETETHFLLHCYQFKSIRNIYINKFTNIIKNFTAMTEEEWIKIILGEGQTAALASRYVGWTCHSLRDSRWTCIMCVICVSCLNSVCFPTVYHSDPQPVCVYMLNTVLWNVHTSSCLLHCLFKFILF